MVVFLLLSLLLDYYYYHYNILLRFLYFGEEEMATQQPPGVEAAKTASVFDVLLLRRFLFSAFGRRWPRAPTFYSENFCPTRLPHRYQFQGLFGKKVDFRHEVSMRKFSYLLQYDKIFSHSLLLVLLNLHCSEILCLE